MARPSFRSVLRQGNFFRLWVGQIVSSVGDRFYQFALLNVVLKDMIGQAEYGKETARIIFFGMLPGLLLAPLFGWVVDHFERRAVMIFTDLVRACLALALIYFGYVVTDFVAIFVIIFFMGAMNGLFIPARQASVPQIVPSELLVTANALIAMVGILASMIASVAAALLIALFGEVSSFVITAIGFLFSAGVILQIDHQLSPQTEVTVEQTPKDLKKRWQKFGHELLVGWYIIRERTSFFALILLKSAFALTSALFLVAVLEHTAKEVDLTLMRSLADGVVQGLTPFTELLSLKPPEINDVRFLSAAILFGCIGLGLGLGVWFCGKSKTWSHWNGLPYLGLLLLGLGIWLYAYLSTVGAVMILAIPLGFFGAIIQIPIDARLQNETKHEHRGRVFALANLCTTTAFLIALAFNLNGFLLREYGATSVVIYLGKGVTLLALAFLFFSAKQLFQFWDNPCCTTTQTS